MSEKKGTGNWKPLPTPTNEPVPARGKVTIGMGPGGSFGKEADIVLPIDPHTLQIVEEEEDE
jgi:hypothetical protein